MEEAVIDYQLMLKGETKTTNEVVEVLLGMELQEYVRNEMERFHSKLDPAGRTSVGKIQLKQKHRKSGRFINMEDGAEPNESKTRICRPSGLQIRVLG